MNTKQKIILIIFIALLLIVGGYFGYSIISKKNNNRSSENRDTLLINKKYKNIYAFKFINDSIYALKDNEEDSLLVDYKEEICGTEKCGALEYEYKDGKLYLYYIGAQDDYYYKHLEKSITVYSIDFTKDDTSLKKEYVISKDDGYVTAVTQSDSSIFFSSYVWEGSTLEKEHKLYEFSKASEELKEIYDLNDYSQLQEIIENNNKLYIEYNDYREETGYKYQNCVLEMNLDDYSTNKVFCSDRYIAYDTISKKILTNKNYYRTIEINNMENYSKKEVTEESQVHPIFYSINDVLIYYVDTEKTIKIRGEKDFDVDLKEYVKEDMLDRYNTTRLADNHSIEVLIYLKSFRDDGTANAPYILRINFLTGEVGELNPNLDSKLSANKNQFLYIK